MLERGGGWCLYVVITFRDNQGKKMYIRYEESSGRNSMRRKFSPRPYTVSQTEVKLLYPKLCFRKMFAVVVHHFIEIFLGIINITKRYDGDESG